MAVSERLPAAVQPLAGAVLGLCGCAFVLLLPRGPGAVAAVILWTAVTLAKGERGFARWLPKLPLFGTLLAGCTILLRWYSLISLQGSPARLVTGVVAAMALGPAASVTLAWISRPVDQPAFQRLSVLSTPEAVTAIAEGVAASVACGLQVGSMLIISGYLLVRLMAGFVNWRFAGVRGSDLDACRVVVDTIALVLVSSLRQAI